MSGWSVTMAERDYLTLHQHLFQADQDEHAAFLLAGLDSRAKRLLVQRALLVTDDDFGPSSRGAYRAVSARTVARAARAADESGLCLIWAHSHPLAGESVRFSRDDLASHRRMHPHLIDMTRGRPVASLVLGHHSAAGEVWREGGEVEQVDHIRVVGRHIRDVLPEPRAADSADGRFARQVLLFGEAGQAILRRTTVAVAGAGGGGSLIVQSLAHLGVGRVIVIDFDTVSESNLARIVGTSRSDIGRLKIDVLRDMVERIDPTIEFVGIEGDITYADDARRLAEADFAFLATDTTYARYAFNATCHQYLIPGIQVGSKVAVEPKTGEIDLVHVMERPVVLGPPCLLCSGAISRDRLRREQLSDAERQAQNYVGDGAEHEVQDPSVITLNSISTSLATTDFLFMVTGLLRDDVELSHQAYYPAERRLAKRRIAITSGCRFCDPGTRHALFAAGDLAALPVRPGNRRPS
jgi:hypothetical protein